MSAETSRALDSIQEKIIELAVGKEQLLIAIDGRCASGKTTLAKQLKKRMDCNIIPMDHFFLQPHMRSAQRLSQPGGNVDYERFLTEVLLPLKKEGTCSYRPYNCRTGKLEDAIGVFPSPLTIVEGSYSCHPALWDYYDYRIFLTTSYDSQIQRIAARNGKNAVSVFTEKWIPLEELYFHQLSVAEKCDLIVTT